MEAKECHVKRHSNDVTNIELQNEPNDYFASPTIFGLIVRA